MKKTKTTGKKNGNPKMFLKPQGCEETAVNTGNNAYERGNIACMLSHNKKGCVPLIYRSFFSKTFDVPPEEVRVQPNHAIYRIDAPCAKIVGRHNELGIIPEAYVSQVARVLEIEESEIRYAPDMTVYPEDGLEDSVDRKAFQKILEHDRRGIVPESEVFLVSRLLGKPIEEVGFQLDFSAYVPGHEDIETILFHRHFDMIPEHYKARAEQLIEEDEKKRAEEEVATANA